MILTDDVYGTFVKGYRSLIADLPYNSMSCYSFSKYYGATGWRIAVTAVSRDNVFDRLISELPDDKKALLEQRYQDPHPRREKSWIYRPHGSRKPPYRTEPHGGIVNATADSDVAFRTRLLLDKEGIYHERMLKLIHDRYNALWKSFGFTMPADPLRADYYSEIDLLVWAEKLHGKEFADYIDRTYNPLTAVFRLASETAAWCLTATASTARAGASGCRSPTLTRPTTCASAKTYARFSTSSPTSGNRPTGQNRAEIRHSHAKAMCRAFSIPHIAFAILTDIQSITCKPGSHNSMCVNP